MSLTRREALVALGGAGAIALTGCAAPRRSLDARRAAVGDPDVQVLSRFGFGPTAEDLDRIKSIGQDTWFEEQLAAGHGEPFALQASLARLPIENLSAWELRDLPENEVLAQMQQAALLRATYSPWQVRERLVHFWSDHFNIYGRKGLAGYRKPEDERRVVRDHALGRFPDMLMASAHSTAMLLYLDQQASTSAHPNENYARELLELHSLGVDEGYTQRDVMEAARCFTGWTEERGFLKRQGSFKFDPALHDRGEKAVLGQRISAGGGKEDGERVVQIVAAHPATARHIGRKLARWYLGSTEQAPAVAKAFLQSGGDIKSTMKEVYRLYKSGLHAPVVKRPFDLAVSAIRALGIETGGGKDLQDHLRKMGQPLYQWPMPDGYPVDAEAWSGSLLARWNFALALTQGQIRDTKGLPGGIHDPADAVASVFGGSLTKGASENLAKVVAKVKDPKQMVALCISSPEFQWR
ncbi:MAG: DUF1800 domain-containing protein [Armatimonadetes bacterium]|nr:DUF1800 domain-containing protein [Armatimonadota bacterium]